MVIDVSLVHDLSVDCRGHLVQSPLALAPCSALLPLLSHTLSPRYSTLFSCNKRTIDVVT